MDQIPFILQISAALAVVAAPIVVSIIVMSREASIELPMPLLFNDPEPMPGIADGDLEPWRLDLVQDRPSTPAPSTPARSTPADQSQRRVVGGCELATAR